MELDRLQLKPRATAGFVQRWYGYRIEESGDIAWTPRPEPRTAPFYMVVVETSVPDEVLVRAELSLMEAEGTL